MNAEQLAHALAVRKQRESWKAAVAQSRQEASLFEIAKQNIRRAKLEQEQQQLKRDRLREAFIEVVEESPFENDEFESTRNDQGSVQTIGDDLTLSAAELQHFYSQDSAASLFDFGANSDERHGGKPTEPKTSDVKAATARARKRRRSSKLRSFRERDRAFVKARIEQVQRVRLKRSARNTLGEVTHTDSENTVTQQAAINEEKQREKEKRERFRALIIEQNRRLREQKARWLAEKQLEQEEIRALLRERKSAAKPNTNLSDQRQQDRLRRQEIGRERQELRRQAFLQSKVERETRRAKARELHEEARKDACARAMLIREARRASLQRRREREDKLKQETAEAARRKELLLEEIEAKKRSQIMRMLAQRLDEQRRQEKLRKKARLAHALHVLKEAQHQTLREEKVRQVEEEVAERRRKARQVEEEKRMRERRKLLKQQKRNRRKSAKISEEQRKAEHVLLYGSDTDCTRDTRSDDISSRAIEAQPKSRPEKTHQRPEPQRVSVNVRVDVPATTQTKHTEVRCSSAPQTSSQMTSGKTKTASLSAWQMRQTERFGFRSTRGSAVSLRTVSFGGE